MRVSEIELFEAILKSLQDQTPFAVARFGDGEYSVVEECELTDSTYIKHIGYMPTDKEKIAIGQGVLNTIPSLDYIGITLRAHGFWGLSRKYFEGIATQSIVSLDFHTYFLENGLITQIVEKATKLLYISGHDINFKKFSNLKEVIHLEIPLQYCKYPEARKYYPEYFNKTMDAIKGMDLTGYLCFVGAGYIGKPFMGAIKERGGVAVDLGSVMDRLAGYIIRGAIGQYGTPDKKYKL